MQLCLPNGSKWIKKFESSFLEPYEVFPIPRRGIFYLHLSEFAIYRILAIYVPSGFGFYDPKKKENWFKSSCYSLYPGKRRSAYRNSSLWSYQQSLENFIHTKYELSRKAKGLSGIIAIRRWWIGPSSFVVMNQVRCAFWKQRGVVPGSQVRRNLSSPDQRNIQIPERSSSCHPMRCWY